MNTNNPITQGQLDTAIAAGEGRCLLQMQTNN